MSERHIGGVVMNDAPYIVFPPPRVRAREPVTYPAPGVLERAPRPLPVRRPTEPDDPPGDDDRDD